MNEACENARQELRQQARQHALHQLRDDNDNSVVLDLTAEE